MFSYIQKLFIIVILSWSAFVVAQPPDLNRRQFTAGLAASFVIVRISMLSPLPPVQRAVQRLATNFKTFYLGEKIHFDLLGPGEYLVSRCNFAINPLQRISAERIKFPRIEDDELETYLKNLSCPTEPRVENSEEECPAKLAAPDESAKSSAEGDNTNRTKKEM